jgi:hypothetical protein
MSQCHVILLATGNYYDDAKSITFCCALARGKMHIIITHLLFIENYFSLRHMNPGSDLTEFKPYFLYRFSNDGHELIPLYMLQLQALACMKICTQIRSKFNFKNHKHH